MTVASIIFDLVMLGIVVAAALIGSKVGFLRMLFAFGIVFIALLLARLLMPVVAAGVEKINIYDNVKNAAQTRISGIIEKENDIDFEGVADELKLPEFIKKRAVSAAEGIGTAKGEELSEKMSSLVASVVVKLSTYAILVLLVIAALIIISLITKLVEKIPVIGGINAAGGAIVGIPLGLLAVLVICIIAFAVGVGKTSGVFADIASGSLLIRLLNHLGVTGLIVRT